MVFASAAFLRFYRLDALPLGFHHDEGLDAVAALEIWTKGQHPIFFPQSGSREPLMIYLESLGILAFGATRLGARVAQACVGTAGVVAAWFVFRELFGRRVALMGAAITAFSFWQMFESRLGLRAISQPLVETLCLLFVWRMFTRRSWSDAVLAGAFAGLTMYTYTASRALPILLLLLVVWQAATAPAFAAKQWSRLAAAGTIALAIFAPLGVYALRHPDEFLGRAMQVSLLNPEPFTGAAYESGGVGSAVLRTLGMFSVQGDPAWKYNIGGLPVFDWPESALFYGGLALAVAAGVSWVRKARRERGAASPHAFVLLWLAVMLLPGFLSGEAPHFLRTIGIIPAVFAFPALALAWLVERWRWAMPLAGLFLAGEAVETGWRYFGQWAGSSEAYYAMHADAADVATSLRRLPGAEPTLFSSEYPGHPTLLYLAPEKFESIRWFNGRQSMAFPPPGQERLYVFTAHYQPGFLDVSRLFQPDQLVEEGRDPEGGAAYRIYRGSPVPPAPPLRVQAEIGGLIRLSGAAAPSQAQGGQAVHVQEYWTALRPGSPDVRAFLHLVDEQGNVWAQADSLGYYAEDWEPGAAAINDQVLDLPPYTPPVTLRLLFGLYSARTGQQLPVASGGTRVDLGALRVQPGSPPPPGWRAPNAVERQVAPNLILAGYELPQREVMAGESLPVNLFWRVTGPLTSAPALQGTGGQESGLASLLPPPDWPRGVVLDRRRVRIAPTVRAGTLTLELAGVKLGDVRVTEPPRDFNLPPVQTRLNVPVADFATLAGYSLDQPLKVTLAWQARAVTGTSYKVFVHLLDGRNQVVAQKDDFPHLPTTSWVPGQVVVDTYDVPLNGPLPPGAQLEIGMYEPSSGNRVSLGSDDHLLVPLNS